MDYMVQFETNIGTYNYVVKEPQSKNEAIKAAKNLGYLNREIQNIKVFPIYETLDCGNPGVSQPPIPSPSISPSQLTQEHWDYLWDCKSKKRKIQAIKWVRAATGMGLKEAKSWVEQELDWPPPPPLW
jgi:hypothetical protein